MLATSTLKAELTRRAAAYEPPKSDELDPSFIFLSPTILRPKDFEVLNQFLDPVEPKVLPEFDWAAQRRTTEKSSEDFIAAIKPRLDRMETVYDRIFEIIRSKRYRAGTVTRTRFDENKEHFRPILQRHIDKGTPLQFLLPSFPYKFAVPFKVARKQADMAEVLCLSQLYEICHAMGQVYEPGVQFVIISDGSLYSSIFGITQYEADTYRDEAVNMIDRLGYGEHISIVDMEHDLIEPVRDAFNTINEKMRPVLREWWDTHPASDRRASLIISSAPNINTAGEVAADLTQMTTKDIMSEPDDAWELANLDQVRENIKERTEEAAFDFALTLYTLKEIDLVQSWYPDAIRGTVHPKPEQWGIHLVNEHTQVFPWQGVAFLSKSGRWTIKYEFAVLRRRAIPVHIRGDMFPFYFEESDDEPDAQGHD